MNKNVAARVDGCPDMCPDCSYPSLLPGLCYFCRPMMETPVIVLTAARQLSAPRADGERSLSGSAGGTLAAAG
jgi:hypothetical protein